MHVRIRVRSIRAGELLGLVLTGKLRGGIGGAATLNLRIALEIRRYLQVARFLEQEGGTLFTGWGAQPYLRAKPTR